MDQLDPEAATKLIRELDHRRRIEVEFSREKADGVLRISSVRLSFAFSHRSRYSWSTRAFVSSAMTGSAP